MFFKTIFLNIESIMTVFRGRTKPIALFLLLFLLIFIALFYSLTSTNNNGVSLSLKANDANFVEINRMSLMTQSAADLQRLKLQEAKIMDNIVGRSSSFRRWNPDSRMLETSEHFKGERIVHLDLKGAPPKITYYKPFFAMLKKLGVTGVLLEYEDMFPFKGTLKNITALNAYSLKDIHTINVYAKEFELKVIPLIQTFGHLEFILKLKQYKELRELFKYPQAICPTNNKTVHLITDMIDQVIAAHPKSSLIHIGADEVYQIGECARCMKTLTLQSWTKRDLFLHHVTKIASYIKKKYPKLTILMWDDEFRSMSPDDLNNWKLKGLVEPVVWKYTSDLSSLSATELWDMYAEAFGNIWIATAFKGATGSEKYTTDIFYHISNHRSWMKLLETIGNKLTIRGAILTGWQRYDHFAVLCELLPVGIPSLVACLAYLDGERNLSASPRAYSDLFKCEGNPLYNHLGTAKCEFPGSKVYDVAIRLQLVQQEFDKLMSDSTVKGWLTEYNVNNKFSSPSHVETAVQDLDRIKMELLYIEQDATSALMEVYDNYTVHEWIQTNIRPLDKQIITVWQAKETLLSQDEWPRRPFPLDSKKEL